MVYEIDSIPSNTSDIQTQWLVLQASIKKIASDVEAGALDESQFRERMRRINLQVELVEDMLMKAGAFEKKGK